MKHIEVHYSTQLKLRARSPASTSSSYNSGICITSFSLGLKSLSCSSNNCSSAAFSTISLPPSSKSFTSTHSASMALACLCILPFSSAAKRPSRRSSVKNNDLPYFFSS
ncbi:hypothetical protein CB0940_03210 [Cercospora beticola]|uniref:Uncharacterized protein n=1 Tax=Cercospora beticola TaxID=122368 RepID=A0A2G5I2W5_CERBT|nr:hypothetical protein CB0940_03210 [Cercospora beticola]PIA98842.1 hypothetical protein CB0940_03210 [Cercospora beticola]